MGCMSGFQNQEEDQPQDGKSCGHKSKDSKRYLMPAKVSHETCSTLSDLLKSSTDTLINKQTCLMFHFPFAGAPYFSFPASQPLSLKDMPGFKL